MECKQCSGPLDENGRCPSCEAAGERVRVMTREEKRAYQGITIDEEGPEEDIRFERRENPWQRVRWTSVGASSWSDRRRAGRRGHCGLYLFCGTPRRGDGGPHWPRWLAALAPLFPVKVLASVYGLLRNALVQV